LAIAHTRNEAGAQQDLVEHLTAVAKLTREFARGLGAEEAGYWLGLWHDIGKFHPRFQSYLAACERDPAHREYVDHKAAGAVLASDPASPAGLGTLMAMVLQAHHGGLKRHTDFTQWLRDRVATGEPAAALLLAREAMGTLEPSAAVPLPAWIEQATDRAPVEMFLRMMFSALVDADSVDTEHHHHPERTGLRKFRTAMADLWRRFESNQNNVLASARDDRLTEVRREVYEAAVAAADGATGFYRLAVPTGGGKTRSAMAFALRHAMRHDLERVIVAVPFLTITDQTAEVYREIFEPGSTGRVVLEHHSQARDVESDSMDPDSRWARLAAEDWGAPVVVTTTVQLFESLFSNTRSDCRKLHRLARSVIILDEAQALPSHVLRPIVDALADLTVNYGTTVVISTATQPAFDVIPEFARVKATDIITNPRPLFRGLSRVHYDWRTKDTMTWDQVAHLMRLEPQILTVVNTKPDAHSLLAALGDPLALHLSTTLCGAHRRHVLDEVRGRLKRGETCRLVTTQVIEAGVDIDFPVLLRALAPLDSVIQAAGRCNREGLRPSGKVIVFDPADGRVPPGAYRVATEKTRGLVATGVDPDDPEQVTAYFRALLVRPFIDTDARGIQALRARLDYPEVASQFQMIREKTQSVLVPYRRPDQPKEAEELRRDLQARRGDPRQLWRRAQPYLVSLPARKADDFEAQGLITEIMPGLGEWHGDYDAVIGLRDGIGPESLVL